MDFNRFARIILDKPTYLPWIEPSYDTPKWLQQSSKPFYLRIINLIANYLVFPKKFTVEDF